MEINDFGSCTARTYWTWSFWPWEVLAHRIRESDWSSDNKKIACVERFSRLFLLYWLFDMPVTLHYCVLCGMHSIRWNQRARVRERVAFSRRLLGHLTTVLYSFRTAAIDLASNTIRLTLLDAEVTVYHIVSTLSVAFGVWVFSLRLPSSIFHLMTRMDNVCFRLRFFPFSILSVHTSSINPRSNTVIYLHLYLFYSHNLFLSAINRIKKMKRWIGIKVETTHRRRKKLILFFFLCCFVFVRFGLIGQLGLLSICR